MRARSFGVLGLITAALVCASAAERVLMTTAGPIKQNAAGIILSHEHLFTDLRGPAHITRLRHVDVVGDAWIVRNNIEELLALLQRAHNAGGLAFENADHRAGVFLSLAIPESLRTNVTPHEDAVFVQGRSG